MLKLTLLLSFSSYAISASHLLTRGNSDNFNPCKVGECVPYYQCSNGTLITDTDIDGLLDIAGTGGTTEEHLCNGYLQICCSHKLDVPFIPDIKIPERCGFRNAEGIGFHFPAGKDNEAQYGEFPWTVAILKEEIALDKLQNVYLCGGSLIHPSVVQLRDMKALHRMKKIFIQYKFVWDEKKLAANFSSHTNLYWMKTNVKLSCRATVLTAAHCVFGKEPNSLKIRAGEWDTQTEDEIFPHQDRQVSEYVCHEKYDRRGLFNDVALLFLAKPVNFAGNVNTICLPPQNMNFDLRTVSRPDGVGKDLYGKEGKYQVILKYVELPVVPRYECLRELRKTRLGPLFELNNSFICAGVVRGKDTCTVDGGSPLVCPTSNTSTQYHQVGIVAWGVGCGDKTPGVYVNLPLFRNWIEEKLMYRRFSFSSFIP